jgi:hypothetical protein
MTKDEIRAAKKFLAQGRPTSPGCVAFMLRSCASDMSAYGGFVWPRSGEVSCPDWKPARECGNGLHGLLWGEGSVSLTAQDDPNANWLVCAVWTTDVVDLGDKVKVPRSFVVFTGSRFDAVAELQKLGARKSHWGIYSAGDSGTATAGDSGTATAGNRGTATAGSRGTATAGYAGTATAGHAGTATAGNRGTATAGDSGTATAGDSGTATAGNRGTATAGHAGTATAGDSGTATAGDSGTATAGTAAPRLRVTPAPRLRVTAAPRLRVTPAPRLLATPAPRLLATPAPRLRVTPAPRLRVSMGCWSSCDGTENDIVRSSLT